MLVRPAFLDAEALALLADPTRSAEPERAQLRGEAGDGTVARGFPTRCAHCHAIQRLPKPVLRGWTCAVCCRHADQDIAAHRRRQPRALNRR